MGAERDRAGRVKVASDLTLPGWPEVFVVGDTAAVLDVTGRPVPGIAPAAKQMGRYAASVIAARARGRALPSVFRYRHQGDLATIGRKAAVVKLPRLTLTGFLGWAFWGLAHVYFLIGLRNRIAVAFSWVWDYVTFGRRARLITEPANARPAEAEPGGPSGTPSATPAASGSGIASEQGKVWAERSAGWFEATSARRRHQRACSSTKTRA